DESEPSHEGAIDVVVQVRGQDREPAVRLHALEQVGDLEVRVAVVAVLDLAAPTEESVRLVEEEDGAARLCRREHLAQVLLRLADVLADRRREIESVQVEIELPRYYLRGQRLAGPALAGEQGGDAEPARGALAEAPALVDLSSVPYMANDLAQDL